MPLRSEGLAISGATPADSWVPRTKLLPVRNDDDIVIDDQLLGAIREATRRSTLTLVRAQGGSGKTTLAAAVAAAETDRPVAWIRLDAEDDAVSLLHLLADALGRSSPTGSSLITWTTPWYASVPRARSSPQGINRCR